MPPTYCRNVRKISDYALFLRPGFIYQVYVVDSVLVEARQPLEELRIRGVELRIDLSPLCDGIHFLTLPDHVVIGQAVVASSHDVQGSQVPPRELHGSEELVPDVGAKDGVFPLCDLRGQTQDDFLNGLVVDLVLKQQRGASR